MDAFKQHGRGLVDVLIQSAFTRDGAQRIALASAVPFLASLVWHFSHTVVEINDGEQSRWLQYWLAQQTQALRRVRRLMLVSAGSLMGSRSRNSRRYRDYGDEEEEDGKEVGDRFSPPKLVETPSAGVSVWSWYGWYPVSIERCAPRSNEMVIPGYPGGYEPSSNYTVTVWFAPNGAAIAKKLILEGRKLWQVKRATKTEIMMAREGHMPCSFKVTSRPSRPLSSVIVHGNTKESLVADCTRFLKSEKWYICKGIPYRRGYLLYGNPGCGKSSLITALAGELRLPIVLVPLNSKSMHDRELINVLSGAPKDSIVLIEDVDCALGAQGGRGSGAIRHNGQVFVSPDRGGVTLSGLLNAIDGVGAQEGRLLFMTTNHREKLDPALIRPGRVDVEFCLQNASKTAAGELFDQFYGNTEPGAKPFDKELLVSARIAFLDEVEDGVHSFAKLQGVLMEARDDPSHAAAYMHKKAEPANDDAEKEEKVEVEEGSCNFGVTCDGCSERPIFGARYKCGTCLDFDLCTACYKKQVHKEHPFLHFASLGCQPVLLEAQEAKKGAKEEAKSEDPSVDTTATESSLSGPNSSGEAPVTEATREKHEG